MLTIHHQQERCKALSEKNTFTAAEYKIGNRLRLRMAPVERKMCTLFELSVILRLFYFHPKCAQSARGVELGSININLIF